MHEQLRILLEKIISHYSQGEYYDALLKAKDIYFLKTGKAFEEDEDYESRMSLFNDWYILDYIREGAKDTLLIEYTNEFDVNPELTKAIYETNHSLFEYIGTTFRGTHILKDILHDKKLKLAKNHVPPSLLKGDLFIGRTISKADDHYLFSGLRIMPKDAKLLMKKQAKKVRSIAEPSMRLNQEKEFLLTTESLKTKWQRYGHVDVSKIFVFPKMK